jgi:hypothetical protein
MASDGASVSSTRLPPSSDTWVEAAPEPSCNVQISSPRHSIRATFDHLVIRLHPVCRAGAKHSVLPNSVAAGPYNFRASLGRSERPFDLGTFGVWKISPGFSLIICRDEACGECEACHGKWSPDMLRQQDLGGDQRKANEQHNALNP